MKKLIVVVCLATLSASAGVVTLTTSPGALGANDTVTWGQLGSDGTILGNTFSATSSGGIATSGSFAGTDGGQVVNQDTSWSGGFPSGDALIWTLDNSVSGASGPLTLAGLPSVFGVGAEIQSDAVGQFIARLELFQGAVSLGFVTSTSNANGDPLFIGALDTSAEVTQAVFSMLMVPSSAQYNNDFAIDTLSLNVPRSEPPPVPEPGSALLLGGALIAIGLKLRRRSGSDAEAFQNRGSQGEKRKNEFMRALLLVMICCAGMVSPVLAQQQRPKGYIISIPMKPAVSAPAAGAPAGALAGIAALTPASIPVVSNPIPMWTYHVTASPALGGRAYSGTIMGLDPHNRGKTTTTIPTQIIPLVITINDGTTTVTYDPTVPDACNGGRTAVDFIANSPIFNNNPYTINGINVGSTQYIDAFQRAQFWSLVGGSNYHLILQESVLPAEPMTITGTNYDAHALFAGCGHIGVVNINTLDAAVTNLIKGPLAATVNAGTFPIFLTRNVVSAESGHSIFTACCVLGYHSAFAAGGTQVQVYSPFVLDTTGAFGGDVSTLAHEMAEAVNDPKVNDATPIWGNIGQVLGGCQNNLEVGDPLSPGFGTPTNEWVVTQNGFTYHLQELAFFSWFYGGPSLGAGGLFSNNGTFKGAAKACPPGGTN